MKTVLIVSLLACSSCLQLAFAQTAAAPANVVTTARNVPKILQADKFEVLPQVVDGGQYTTQVVISNLNQTQASYQVDFFDDNGASVSFNFVDIGNVSSLSGSLNPGQTVTFSTAGQETSTQGWALISADHTDYGVSVYEIVRSSLNSLNAAETPVMGTYGFYGVQGLQSGVMQFDNTNGFLTSMALVNADVLGAYGTNSTLNVTILDDQGNTLGQHTVTLNAGQHIAFILSDKGPEVNNARGSLVMSPSDGNFTAISAMGLRYYITGSSFTFTTLPIMQPYYVVDSNTTTKGQKH